MIPRVEAEGHCHPSFRTSPEVSPGFESAHAAIIDDQKSYHARTKSYALSKIWHRINPNHGLPVAIGQLFGVSISIVHNKAASYCCICKLVQHHQCYITQQRLYQQQHQPPKSLNSSLVKKTIKNTTQFLAYCPHQQINHHAPNHVHACSAGREAHRCRSQGRSCSQGCSRSRLCRSW